MFMPCTSVSLLRIVLLLVLLVPVQAPAAVDCEAEKLTPEQCAAAQERVSTARGAMQDTSDIINPAFGTETYPPNTEALLPDEKFTLWLQDEALFKPELDDNVLYDKRLVRDVETIKLNDRVPGIRFDAGSSDIPPEFIDKLRGVLSEMQGRENVRLHFIGHTDNAALTGALRAQHGDNAGLSAARAQMVARKWWPSTSSVNWAWLRRRSLSRAGVTVRPSLPMTPRKAAPATAAWRWRSGTMR
jgi:outer membrane protein OmpA-like peptidoglycan-associated protein